MMDIFLDNRIRIEAGALPPTGIDLLRRRLTFQNPLYRASGTLRKRYADREITATLCAMWDDQNGNIFLARGFLEELRRILNANGIDYVIHDLTRRFPPCGFPTGIGHEVSGPGQWPEHLKVLRELEKHPFGCLVGSSGTDKMLLACKLIALRQVPALIIVNGKSRMYDVREKVATFFRLSHSDIGLIGDRHCDLDKSIVLAIPLSLYKVIEEVEQRTGFVVVDRCDQVSLNVYYAVSRFNCQFLLGLADANKRLAGLTRMMWAYLGPRICELPDRQDFPGRAPVLKIRETGFECQGEEYRDVVSTLCDDEARNRLVAKDISQAAAVREGVLVVSERSKHIRDLLGRVQHNGGDGVVIDGRTSKSARKEALESFNEGKVRVLLATVRSVEPALMATVDVIILASPIKHADRMSQIISKLRFAKKQGIILDYQDGNPLLRGSLKKRVKMLLALGVVQESQGGE